MATYKDRIALPPVNAQKTNMTCHFCIVGCGYHVYKWDANARGRPRAATRTRSGSTSASSCRRWRVIMTPAMTNVDHGQGRHALQHHDRAGQGLLGESGPVVDARRQDGHVMYTADGVGKERLQLPARLRRRPVARHQLGRRAGDLRRR